MDLQAALEILARAGAGETLSVADLTAARDTIARALHALKGENAPDLDALTTLREAYFAANSAVELATEQEANADAAVDDALSDIPDPDAEDNASDMPDDEEEEEEDEEDADADADDKSAKDKKVKAPAVPKKGKMLSIQEALQRLDLAPTPNEDRSADAADLSETTSRVIINGEEVKDASMRDIAEAFKESTSLSSKSGKERVVRIETTFAEDRMLSGKVGENTQVIDSFVSQEAINAAGGCCSLPTPIYSNPVSGTTDRPIRDSLITLGADRGKFTFYPAICLPTSGVGLWSCAEDALVDAGDDTTWKDVYEVECDEAEEVTVRAIYSSATIGNYQARFAVEQWQGYLASLAVQQARTAEVALFAEMRLAVTTTHTLEALGSVYANMVNGVALAGASMRQEQRLGDVQLNFWVADWIRAAVRRDMIARRVHGVAEDPNLSDAMLATAFANEGINVTYSQDLDAIEGASGAQDGALTEFPLTAGAVLAPEGFFTYLDGGTMDMGTEIRDFDLDRQNKVATFVEGYEGLLARGCNAKALDIPVEIADNADQPAWS